VATTLRDGTETYASSTRNPDNGRGGTARIRKDIRVRLRNIAKLSRDLLEALDEIDDEVFRVCHVDRVSVVGLLATLLDVPLRHFAKSQPKKKVAHRPRGSIQNPILRMLILDLYRSVVEQGRGKLTLRKLAARAQQPSLPG
jgi:hypothetical protein